MRRLSMILLAFAVFGCSKEPEPVEIGKPELCPSVRESIERIVELERASDGADADVLHRVLDVRGLSAKDFRKELESFPGEDVHVWMPGEKDWLLVSRKSADKVSLAKAMDLFADDTNCTMSVAEVFASYAGTRGDILPAFDSVLKGEVVPEWFITREIPALAWLDASGIDADIRDAALAEIRSMQVVRRLVLQGNMLAAKATDKKTEEPAVDAWSRAALRNPKDPMILERVWNLKRNGKGFLEVGKVLQAMKCYETALLIRPKDVAAVRNFGACLMKIGKRDMAEEVLKRAEKLSQEMENCSIP